MENTNIEAGELPPANEVIERLEILRRKLEDEGRYVGANTAALAIDTIQALQRGASK